MATNIDKILHAPPTEIENELIALRKELDTEVPKKTVDQNLLIATWNLRSFGDLTEKWIVTENDSPKRNLHALRCITEIIQRFDIVALQEVTGNIKCLRHMLKALGTNWSFVLTDVTKGDP